MVTKSGLKWSLRFCMVLLLIYLVSFSECGKNKNKGKRKRNHDRMKNKTDDHHRRRHRRVEVSTISYESTQYELTTRDFSTFQHPRTSSFVDVTELEMKSLELTSSAPLMSKNNLTISPFLALSTTQYRSKTSKKPKKNRYKIISTAQGKIRGKRVEIPPDKEVFAFLGIQYGKPPIKENRFKPSQPVDAWKGVKDALKFPPSCFQIRDHTFDNYTKDFRGTSMWNANTEMSEDCLYLNIWTPARSKNKNLAVMVWIFGGGYYSGTSSLDVYDGKWLAATQNVVVVSMNYRVAALGFLYAESDEIPGNAGLYDQQLCLKWIQNNIDRFGGNPNRVTVFGESSGAASITLHMMAEGSKGLFRNAILQSASALSPWSILSLEEAKRRAMKLAEKLDCDDIITCLQQVNASDLVQSEMALADYGTARFPNAAVVDGNFLKESPFKMTNESYFNNEVNVLAGFNANEGYFWLVYGSPGFELDSESFLSNQQFESGIEMALREEGNQADNILIRMSHYTYTGGRQPWIDLVNGVAIETPPENSLHNQIGNANAVGKTFYRNRLDDLVGDMNFVCPTIRFLDVLLNRRESINSSVGEVYLYKFIHRSSQNPWPEWMGVMHGYEIEFVFGIPLDPKLQYTASEVNISRYVMKMWSNFAKYDDPNGRANVTWSPYNQLEKNIQIIGTNDSRTSSLLSDEFMFQLRHCAFWMEYFPEIKHRLAGGSRGPCMSAALSPRPGSSSGLYVTSWLWFLSMVSLMLLK